MKALDAATVAAYVAAPENGIRIRDVVSFRVRSLDGASTQTFYFWNDIDTVTLQVVRGDTGATESRTFIGDGALLKISGIVSSSDLTIQSPTISMSQIHATVQNMARGYDMRQAHVEVHRVLFDPRTNAVVGPGHSRFIGKVNKEQISTPKTGEEGSIELSCVSHVRELTRTNPAKKSDETQKRRSGDRFRRHVGVANVQLFWGQGEQRAGGASNSSASPTGYIPKSGGR